MNNRTVAGSLVAAAAIAGVGGYLYLHRSVKPGAPLISATSSSTQAKPSTAAPTAPVSGTIYIPRVAHKGGDNNDLLPKKYELAPSKSPAKEAIQDLISEPQSPLPAGTRLINVSLASGLATVDFSKEFLKNFHGGDLQEAQAINGILMTLGQFPTIDRVQVLVEGATVDSLGGHFDLSTPVDVERPGVQQANNAE